MPMARPGECRDRWRPVALIWALVASIVYLGFRVALENSKKPPFPAPPGSSVMSAAEKRAALYDRMGRDLDEKGPAFLRVKTSQTLLLSNVFELKDGVVTPVLKAVSPPVRANVLYMSPEYSAPIAQVVRDTFLPYFDKAIWFQNTSLYHSSMFHASHHITTIFAADTEIEAEANAVKAVADVLCPLKVILDRVVLTSTGVLLGCWQVVCGSDPFVIRTKLRDALPHAPEKQLYDPLIFHTSFARLLGYPNIPLQDPSDELKFFHDLVARVNNKLQGFQATISDLWFVEEFDVLALALDGEMKIRKFPLGCAGSSTP